MILLFLCSAVAMAGETPTFELFGGYSYQRANEVNLSKGWNFSFAGHVARDLSIVGDVSGHYKSWTKGAGIGSRNFDVDSYFFLAGLQYAYHNSESVTPFIRGLIGSSYSKMNVSGSVMMTDSSNNFAFGFGGGVDMKLTDSMALRLFQADYIRRTGSTMNEGNVYRLSAGITFRAI